MSSQEIDSRCHLVRQPSGQDRLYEGRPPRRLPLTAGELQEGFLIGAGGPGENTGPATGPRKGISNGAGAGAGPRTGLGPGLGVWPRLVPEPGLGRPPRPRRSRSGSGARSRRCCRSNLTRSGSGCGRRDPQVPAQRRCAGRRAELPVAIVAQSQSAGSRRDLGGRRAYIRSMHTRVGHI